MTKRPGQPCGDTDRVRVKCRVELRDDGGEREPKVEMDTPLPGQVPSYVDSDSDPDLAVPGQPDSKMVKDKWKPEDHAALDAYLNNCYPFQPYSRPILELILVDMLNKFAEQNGHKVEAKKIIEDYEWFRGFLIMQWQSKSFMKVRRLKILQPPSIPPSSFEEVEEDTVGAGPATVESWKVDFKGNAAKSLLDMISVNLAQENVCAQHASIINSSGTGKSRMVDELGRTTISVPICLRKEGSQGYPPPDDNLRDWLLTLNKVDKTQEDVAKLLHGFIHSLLLVTLKRLEDIEAFENTSELETDDVENRQRLLADLFHHLMTAGDRFKEVNEYRKSFFADVIDKAKKFAAAASETYQWPDNAYHVPINNTKHGIVQAGIQLKDFIDKDEVTSLKKDGMKRPLVVLAFDEAHILTEFVHNRNWSIYSELHRCLRCLIGLPIFTLFLSTAGKFSLFYPKTQRDSSTWVAQGLKCVSPPITETGFDQLALPAVEGRVKLDEVVQDEWICRLGRPLFASRYIVSKESDRVRSRIPHFATQKLLGGCDRIETNPSDTSITLTDRSIACLSARFPLEFDFSNPNARLLVHKQIEHHMRLCIVTNSNFEVLSSTVGSEPLLAEAAFHAMTDSGTSPIRELSRHMEENCINHGEHGELIAAMLVMQARDALTKGSSRRWVYVCEFMETLLGDSALCASALPAMAYSGEGQKSLADRFKNSRMWFNHVLKVRKADFINIRHLWKFITRGATILYANNQHGVDIVLPVCYSGDVLSRHTVTAILIQVKDDTTFGEDIHGYLFDAMDPFKIKLFDEDMNPPLPIIRMVFALASKEDAVKYVVSPHIAQHPERPDTYTSYDVWCAKMSQKTFPVIGDDELTSYEQILDRIRFPGQEHALSKIHEMTYPPEVEKKKAGLLRSLDAPVERERDVH